MTEYSFCKKHGLTIAESDGDILARFGVETMLFQSGATKSVYARKFISAECIADFKQYLQGRELIPLDENEALDHLKNIFGMK